MASPYNTLNPYFDFYHQNQEQNFYRRFYWWRNSFIWNWVYICSKSKRRTNWWYFRRTLSSFNNSILSYCFEIRNSWRIWAETGDIMSQFGFRMNNTATWIFSKRVFRNLKIPGRDIRPLEGDLIVVRSYAK